MLSLNTFIDALFAGRFIGENALASISLALPLTSIINGFALSIGDSTFVFKNSRCKRYILWNAFCRYFIYVNYICINSFGI